MDAALNKPLNEENIMNQYKVTCFCGWNQKSKVRIVEDISVQQVRLNNKAVSYHMMANGWYVLKVEDMNGNVLFECAKEAA